MANVQSPHTGCASCDHCLALRLMANPKIKTRTQHVKDLIYPLSKEGCLLMVTQQGGLQPPETNVWVTCAEGGV